MEKMSIKNNNTDEILDVVDSSQVFLHSSSIEEHIAAVIEEYMATRTQQIKVTFEKIHDSARVPTRAHWNDAAYDVWSYDMEEKPDGRLMYKTGIKMAMPNNYLALVFPRSSTSKLNLILGNCVAVFDAGYRGEILIPYKTLHLCNELYNTNIFEFDPLDIELDHTDPNRNWANSNDIVKNKSRYNVLPEKPERIAQMLFIPRTDVNWEEVTSLEESDRGDGNFGHTGQH